MALINLLHPAYVCVMRTAKCHTYTLLYTHTHSRCIFPNLVLCACFIRLCCWSDKVARFELSRPHMSAWGQSNYRWWSRWWCIQANTHCNISMSWHSLYARKCSLCSLMIIQANISVDLKTYQTTDILHFANEINIVIVFLICWGLHQQVANHLSIWFDTLILISVYQLPAALNAGP